ncbi:MAG: sortase [Actinomycetota bacterium]|nr:sortase [Rubrobacter sp.]MDQ3507611.1 sortase [Actinomycetota bacterium]
MTALPILPVEESASAELAPVAIEQAGTLLGEDGASLNDPEDAAAPASGGGESGAMTLSIPKLDIEDLSIPEGSTQKELDDEGIIHMAGSGVPWRDGSNTFIVGHALGFMQTEVPYVFYDLDEMDPGDEILITDPRGNEYTFEVYDRMVVEPQDYWVTFPSTNDETIVSLQSCTPIPTFEKRLIVQGRLVA